jgi:SAM-dependent methyltransferase
VLEEYAKPIRKAEIDALRQWFPPNARVLEIGGGTGYQASIIASWGCRVISIDLPNRPAEEGYYPVIPYDGRRLPFRDRQFDVVFSSNVLDDIAPADLQLFFKEMRKVADGGVFVHILPSSTWRFWCMLTHYPAMARLAVRYLTGQLAPGAAPAKTNVSRAMVAGSRPPLLRMILSLLIDPPQGAYSSAFAEVYYFSRRRWRRVFERGGFRIVKTAGNGLFYSGYGLLPELSLGSRAKLARFLGNACTIFVLRASETCSEA